MSDLNNDVRLAVDTGKVNLGYREVLRAIHDNKAKTVVLAAKGKKDIINDINHLCRIAGIRTIMFGGNSVELGAICGKPYSINSLAILDPGNSNVLNETYN
ncbi:MAG: 50S ribosomal protein L30e [Candidatus Micrarchaeota archaeon]|nr:50S ribosomal protein L30e [Candidatus Micrarchaeota archaeon]